MKTDLPVWRRALAVTAGLGVAARFGAEIGHDVAWVLWAYVALLVGAAALSLRGTLAAQLAVRAAWWANLLLGALIALSSARSERAFGAQLAIAAGVALIALGRKGLDAAEDGGGFVPKAFRTTLLAVMVMALADALTLGLFGALSVTARAYHGPGPSDFERALPLALAAPLALGFVGLLRLRFWGLLLDLAADAGILVALATRSLDLPIPLKAALGATAVLKFALVTPLFVAIARGRAPEARALSNAGVRLGAAAVVGLVGISCAAAWVFDRALLPLR